MTHESSVDDYIGRCEQWRDQLNALRAILCSTSLVEDFKWGAPCYTVNGKNVVGLLAFKSYFGLWFHQGALIDDVDKCLINAQSGKTKALRQWRMNDATNIDAKQVKRYVNQAIINAKAGNEIKPVARKSVEVVVPVQLRNALRRRKGATAAFRALRLAQQREFASYIADAKRDTTKIRRIEKILPLILAGAGLNDRYR